MGFDAATSGDEVFRQLVFARISEPTSKQDSLRVLAEVGIDAVSYPTVKRRPPVYARDQWREALAAACAAHTQLGPASLVLFDVSDVGTGSANPATRRNAGIDPQVIVGLLVDPGGFTLMVYAFTGNTAETATMLPMIEAFKSAHQATDVTIVADAGMISDKNMKDIEKAGWSAAPHREVVPDVEA